MPVPRLRRTSGPAVLSYGFRPFFLLGSAYAGLAIALWLPFLMGDIRLDTAFSPVDWHVHEMLFGYVAAIVTGFLLTAIPNWTGRLPVQGAPLLVLVSLWLAGRFAVAFSAEIGWLWTGVIDCLFLLAVAAAAANEVAAGRNWRNLKVVAGIGLLLLANVAFHVEVRFTGTSDVSRRLAVGDVILLIMLIGGRIIPSFTRNWIVRENPGRLPAPFGRFDAVAVLASVVAIVSWVAFPDGWATGGALLTAAAAQSLRMARWAGTRTFRDPLVLILHVAYAFVPIGLLLAGLSALLPGAVPPAAGLHALGVGAVGTMTLSVMVRATLGHTGHVLKAGPGGVLVFTAVGVSAIARVLAALLPAIWLPLLATAAVAWVAAFFGFTVLFGPMLLRSRVRD